eukprot:scaffold192019_cov27-Tisochrysis_lutea.AAC.4
MFLALTATGVSTSSTTVDTESNVFTSSKWPPAAAKCRGVLFSESSCRGDMPWRRSVHTTPAWPLYAAQWSGLVTDVLLLTGTEPLSPLSTCSFGAASPSTSSSASIAPLSSRTLTTASWPFAEAHVRADQPE